MWTGATCVLQKKCHSQTSDDMPKNMHLASETDGMLPSKNMAVCRQAVADPGESERKTEHNSLIDEELLAIYAEVI